MTRKAGILLAVSSLPSVTGIGDFGPSSYRFIDLLSKSGMKCWQILPLNPLGYGSSPYQPYSSFAMDELYLSLELLEKDKLISGFKKYNAKSKRVDYDAVRAYKAEYLKEAFKNFKENKAYKEFIQQKWVRNYALFLTLKKHNDNRCWLEWPLDQQLIPKGSDFDCTPFEEDIRYEMFIQFKLVEQWSKLKKYANKKGIQLVGDIPIYVGIDSEDVWSHQTCFLLDDKSHPTFIAGVPPDYFSATGQRWGNPLYDWDYLKEHDFDFWVERLTYNSKLYDVIRIDHFRAFDTYWKIPVSCPTAIDGEWIEAPGYELFDCLFSKIDGLNIIAEDLGDLREEVLVLRDHYNFPGMKIIQFEFDPSTYKADPTRTNAIVYTGTHDNQMIRAWASAQSASWKRQAKKFFKDYTNETLHENFVELTFADPADTAILPMQDVLGLTDAGRMNTPGTIGTPNWEWKLVDFDAFEEKIPALKKLVKKYNR